jgi:hypothetical protein
LGDDIPFEGDERREPSQRQGGILQGMNPYAEPGAEYIEHLAGVVEGTEQPVEVSEATKTIAQMFDEGTVMRARDLPPSEVKKAGTIGKQKAMSLHIRITQGKKRTEAELQEEILKPLGLEHLRDLPLKMLSQVERWIDGADIGAEYDERQKKQ